MKKILLSSLLTFWSFVCPAQNWSPLGSGLQNFPGTSCMYTDTVADILYVGGPFTVVDGSPVRGIAGWDGAQWSPLRDGIDSFPLGPSIPAYPKAMVRWANELYVCGGFKWAGDVPAKHLARWNGTNWDTIPGGQPNDAVSDVKVINNELYICGSFDSIGSVAAGGIAKWNGSAWSQVGNYSFVTDSTTGVLHKMEYYHGVLYVAGNFEDTSGLTCNFAVWNGSGWQFMSDFSNNSIWDITVYNDELYVAGDFNTGWGNPGNCIVRWNDTAWRDVGGSVDWVNVDRMTDLQVYNNKLYSVGYFQSVGGVPAQGLASWDGTDWCGYATLFETGAQQAVLFSIAFLSDTMYVGGAFNSVNNMQANSIVRWTGGTFVDTCGNTTSIEDLNSETTFSLFPNPVNAELKVEFQDVRQRAIFIMNSFGQQVYSGTIFTREHTVHTESYVPGIYFYCILEEGGTRTNRRFVVLH